ncbi:GATOR1 complex protein NPRL2 [Metopolophium dirhodum]|uniref:GATOR1 complex protein NPRL2 n=1 Tax=Metopolophium dirhodum TaxID=44670 RepID=UPI00298F70F7|nr:GATOR1 complex protein NPRL2 [Metopolophium dirhodum]
MEPLDPYDNPIKCIFVCHFHHTAGPKILCQVPKDFMSKDTFETVSVYMIPKGQLQKFIITITTRDNKILGYPIQINDQKYLRNAYYFNLCFVCDHNSHTLHYEPIVKKLSSFLLNLEIEDNFLSKSDQSEKTQEELLCLMSKVMDDLNLYKRCTLIARQSIIYLNVIEVSCNPPTPLDFDVPLPVSEIDLLDEQWDLTTRQVAPFIDGVNHVCKISELSKLDIEVVAACIQNLVYCNAVSLVDLFRYSNMYVCTTKIGQLARNKSRYDEAISAISRPSGPKATFKDIFTVFSAMRQGSRFIDVCLRFNPVSINIDERNLVLYGLANGYIRQLRKYPVVLKEKDVEKTYMGSYYNGLNSLNIISCFTNSDVYHLDEEIERDIRIVSVWK